ncbi:right-handed parallel beta-helix repeat-containing protein [Cellulomonas sp. 179-A 9B4 NHS]|uniref:hypothetical protein n=1 Tax=Cellulomonas sp. 179-A 9B4 NHS TaxID=3142379 RepID=UPI0039A212AB
MRADLRAAALLLALATLAACSPAADTGAPDPTPTSAWTPPPSAPTPAPLPSDEDDDEKDDDDEGGAPADATAMPGWMTEPAAEAPACPAPTVTVSSADELQAALDAAAPGHVIGLADGVYRGEFVARTSGTAQQPIALCGGRGAVLDGEGVKGGYALHLDGAQHWHVDGFTISNAQKAVMADGTAGTTISRLRIHHIGDEAVHLRRVSTDNLVTGNVISDTGLRKPKFGEGVYVGTAESNFCDITDCEPDASHRNRVVANAIFATTSEAVDVKEGTEDGLVARNQFDGSGLEGDADSWVDVKGRAWTVEDNTGRHSSLDGFQTHEIIDGWGTDNVFRRNRGELDASDGFLVAPRPARDNVVECSNELLTQVGAVSPDDCT